MNPVLITPERIADAHQARRATSAGKTRLVVAAATLVAATTLAVIGEPVWGAAAASVGSVLVLAAGMLSTRNGLNRELLQETGQGVQSWLDALRIGDESARPAWARTSSPTTRTAAAMIDKALGGAARTSALQNWSAALVAAACAIGVSVLAMELTLDRPAALIRIPVRGPEMEQLVSRMLPGPRPQPGAVVPGSDDPPTLVGSRLPGAGASSPVETLDGDRVGAVTSQIIDETLPAALAAQTALVDLAPSLERAARAGDAASASQGAQAARRTADLLKKLAGDPNVDKGTADALRDAGQKLDELEASFQRLAGAPGDENAINDAIEKIKSLADAIKKCLDALQRLIEALMSLLDVLFGANSGIGAGGKAAGAAAINGALGQPGGSSGNPSQDPGRLAEKISAALRGSKVVALMPPGWNSRIRTTPGATSDNRAPDQTSGVKNTGARRNADPGGSKTDQKLNQKNESAPKVPPAVNR